MSQNYIDIVNESNKNFEENKSLQRQIEDANHLLNRYHDETMREIKFPDFHNVRCNLSRLLCGYQHKYKVNKME